MNKLLLAVDLFVAMASASFAGTVEQQLLASLQAQGYVVVEQSYTILGRLHVVARIGDVQREIVVNPGTGEVLRDTSVAMVNPDPGEVQPAIVPDDALPPDPGSIESLPPDATEAGDAGLAPASDDPAGDPDLFDAPQGGEAIPPPDGAALPGGLTASEFLADDPAPALPEQMQ